MIMSLLDTTTKKLLVVASILIVVPGIAVVAYAMHFEFQPQESAERQKKEAAEKQREAGDFKVYYDRETLEIKQALERETDPEKRAKLEVRLRDRERGRRIEKEAQTVGYGYIRDFRGAGLAAAKWAKIPMEQAIQIATSQNPGSVMQCNLYGEREDKVVYEVIVLTGDEPNLAFMHVIVSAIDGAILKTEKEMLRTKEKP
jgi:uncharacterized membrane protein YkoI